MFDDDQQTPNTLNCAFEYNRPGKKPVMLEFEVRHWDTNHEAGIGMSHKAKTAVAEKASNGLGPQEGSFNTIGNIFYGSNGYLAIDSAGGYESWLGKEREPGPSAPASKATNFQNFIDCVVSRKKEDLNAPIEEGNLSVSLIHLANASYRLGRTLHFDPQTRQVIKDDEANRLLRDGDRGYRPPFVVPEQV